MFVGSLGYSSLLCSSRRSHPVPVLTLTVKTAPAPRSQAGSSPPRAPRARSASPTPVSASTVAPVSLSDLYHLTISPSHHRSTLTRADSSASAGKILSLRPCTTTGPCNPTFGNAQIWWGLQGSSATDYWIELSGTPRVRPKHTGLCVRADMAQGRAVLARCSPSHDNVTAVDQLWSTQQHG